MNQYTIYCSDEQTLKAIELGAPIEIIKYDSTIIKTVITFGGFAIVPTAEQMIGWLRKEIKLAISVDYNIQNDNKPVWFYSIFNVAYSNTFSEPEDATLAAIDAALEYLTNRKK